MKRLFLRLVVSLFITILVSASAWAQAPAAGVPSGNAPPALSSDELENLVGRIALYPDELIAIVLPASTYPVQIVQAARFLEDNKTAPQLKPRESWDTSVLSLLNYPEVIQMMDKDLDWTAKLGDAVIAQQKDVMDAIQHFRTRAYAAGNLKTDDKQVIVEEKQTIIIKSADPEVIYVPQYQPQVVVVAQTYPAIIYYPTPYPVYYSPAATFYSGMFVGAAIAYGVGWHHHNIHHGHHGDVNINRNTNVNRNRENRQKWKPGAGSGSRPGNRPGVTPGKRPGYRPGTTPGNRPGNAPNRYRTQNNPRPKAQSQRPSAGQGSNRFANQSRGRSAQSGAFSGYGRGRNQGNYRNRGSQSRSSMNRGSRSSGRSFSGGGGRRGGGRGGRR